MKLNKAKGNMYDWVTHTWSPMVGCMHQCEYCYVKTYREQPVEPKILLPWPNLESGHVIFVAHMCDMFAANVPEAMIGRILVHCKSYDNKYVFQTKNPSRLCWFFWRMSMPNSYMAGTTIETNRQDLLDRFSKAPMVIERSKYMGSLSCKKFITIEPIMDFDVDELADLIIKAKPTFVNIGADSKHHGLPEPSGKKVMQLVQALGEGGVVIRKKVNLERLLRQ